MAKAEIIFSNTGLNSDSSQEFINKGDSPADYTDDWGRRNVVFSPGDNNVLENVLGAKAIDDSYEWGAITPKYTGYARDTQNNLYYLFFKDTTAGSNVLLEYNPDTGTNGSFDMVVWGDTSFELDDRFLRPEETPVIDGWIYYNGGQYGLKKINIAMAKLNWVAGHWISGGSYQIDDLVKVTDGRVYKAITNHSSETTDPRSDTTNWEFDSQYTYPNESADSIGSALYLDRVNVPPITAITFVYDSDTTRQINNLRGKQFQFTYRYKYRYHGYSRTAPISLISLPPDEESIKGEVLNSITTNNHLDLSFSLGNLGLIEWVELFVREGNSGTWYYVKKFTEGEGTYAFYNDVALEAVDDSIVETMADAIPKQSDAEVYCSENRILSAGNTEGYDDVDLDVTLAVAWNELSITTPDLNNENDSFSITQTEVVANKYIYGVFDINDVATDTSQGDYVKVYVISTDPSHVVEVGFTFQNANGAGSELTDFRDECISAILGDAIGITAGYSPIGSLTINNGDFWVKTNYYGVTVWTGSYIKTYDPVSGEPNKWPSLKTGATHAYAIQYYDEQMRPFAAITSDDTEIYIPTLPEANGAGSALSDTYSYRPEVSWAISHAPPSDAAYWQWLYAGNRNISNFWTYIINSSDGAKNTTSDYDTAGSVYTCLDISPLNNASTVYPMSNVSYTWQAGDRVRILTLASSVDDTYGDLVAYANISDVETVAYDSTYERLVLPYDSNKYYAGNSSLIEIYRPKTTAEETIYYTIGPVYETYTSGATLYHRGSSQDQTATNGSGDAEGTFTRGDAYFITRAFSEAVIGDGSGSDADTLYLVESPSYSDFYTSDNYDYGKINVESDKGEVVLTDVRWSNPYFQDTDVNGLCTYDALDYKTIPDKYGTIQALRQFGDVLRVYTDDKALSIWVGKTEYFDAEGQSTISTSTSVLGSLRPQVADIGTVNRESVCQTDKYIYGFDMLKGKAWRDTSNGIFAISGSVDSKGVEYKMFKWFRDKSGQLRNTYTTQEVHVEYDDFYEMIFYYFKTATSTQTEVVAYHEPSNRWVGFFDHKSAASPTSAQIPDGYMRTDNRFFSFLVGEMYRHNDTSVNRATFYGLKHDVLVDFIVNEVANEVKVFSSIAIHTDGEWTVDDLEIPENNNYPNGMVSKIPSTEWKKREGKYEAHFLRNMKTSSASSTALDLRNGEPLRGETMYVKLKNTSTSKVRLFKVDIIYEISNA